MLMFSWKSSRCFNWHVLESILHTGVSSPKSENAVNYPGHFRSW